jgi:hypothetical protein
MVGEGGV